MATIITTTWEAPQSRYFISVDTDGNHVTGHKLDDSGLVTLQSKSFPINVTSIDYSRQQRGVVVANDSSPTIFQLVKTFPDEEPEFADFEPVVLRASDSRISSCVAFNTNDVLAVGLERSKNHHGVHVYSNPLESKKYTRYLLGDAVVSTTFLTQNPNILLVGTQNALKEIDIRTNKKINFQHETPYTEHLKVGPYADSEHYFASVNSKLGNLALWDRRYLAAPLVLPELFNSTYHKYARPNFAFNSSVRMEMATLHQSVSGSSLHRWQFGEDISPGVKESLFVAKNRQQHMMPDSRAIAFDHFEDTSSGRYVVLTASGKVRIEHVGCSGNISSFGSANDIVITDGKDIFFESPSYTQSASGPPALLRSDIASVMHHRVATGYSLADLELNSKLFSSMNEAYTSEKDDYLNSNYEELRICWKWLYQSYINSKRLPKNGININFEGVYNIWDGVEEIVSDENRRVGPDWTNDRVNRKFVSLLEATLNSVKDPSKNYTSIFYTQSKKKVQRLYCLFVTGWLITSEEFDAKIDKLLRLELVEKAAGLCVFNGDIIRAISILDNSKIETLEIIAAAMSGFLNNESDDSRPQWKQHCEKLSESLGSPYLRAIFAYLVDRKWRDVLYMPSLPLKEKLLIAFRYLPDNRLTEYLKTATTAAVRSGEPDGIMLTGLTRKGLTLLSRYNDLYGDIQTAALVSSFAVPKYFDDLRATNWIKTYRELLNSWECFSERAKFDIRRRYLSKNDFYVPKEPDSKQYLLSKKEKQLYLKCINCGLDISGLLTKKGRQPQWDDDDKSTTITCYNCRSPLPKCAICLYSLGAPIRYIQEPRTPVQVFGDWGCFCLSCNHGMHSIHASEWFDVHKVCPVPDCECECRGQV